MQVFIDTILHIDRFHSSRMNFLKKKNDPVSS
jgi:hypothetical protein